MQTGSLKVDGSPRPRSTRVHWLEVEQRLSADASVRQPAAPKKVAKLKRIEGFSREGTFARRLPPLRSFGPGCTGCDCFFISENDDLSSRRRKVISLVERREETWDGKAERTTAPVTGSTDGVGRLIARKLGQAGARVLVSPRRCRAVWS